MVIALLVGAISMSTDCLGIVLELNVSIGRISLVMQLKRIHRKGRALSFEYFHSSSKENCSAAMGLLPLYKNTTLEEGLHLKERI